MTKKERVLAVMKGERVDKVPAGFWFHYGPQFNVQQMIDAHMELFDRTDMDVIKIMQDYPYPVSGEITCADDWYHINMKGSDSAEFEKMSDIIRGIRQRAGDDVLIFQTMFGPFKAASIAFGDDVLMKYSKEAPEAVKAGIQILTDRLAEWAESYMKCGADGIYYSAQFGEPGRFTREEWEALVRPYDIQVLDVAKKRMKSKFNITHICGEPEYQFRTHVDWFTDYPADLINWSVKDNGVSLTEGRKIFRSAILGGMNNKGNILRGPAGEIVKEVRRVLDEFGTDGIMLGADCTIQGENISLEYIAEAVRTAHEYI